ncbi:hypothetical protein M8J75_004543 [Diaphorina citri]|nr:hypothetical protein M8J75_004543 [Diaphorina citri]
MVNLCEQRCNGKTAAIGDMSILRTFDCTPRNQLDHGYFLKLERITKNRCPRMYEDFKFGASDVQCWSTSSSIIGSWVKDEMVKNENCLFKTKLGFEPTIFE